MAQQIVNSLVNAVRQERGAFDFDDSPSYGQMLNVDALIWVSPETAETLRELAACPCPCPGECGILISRACTFIREESSA